MDSIKKLQNLFSEFPTIGSRTASRFVFYLLKLPKDKIDELVNAISELKEKTKLCAFCFNPHELENNFCSICSDTLRNKQLLCIVEKETDLISIENIPNSSRTLDGVGAKKYNGLYFILGGSLNSKKINMDNLRINELKERIKKMPHLKEIIIATNTTPEGNIISVLIERALKENNQSLPKITHLGRGLPLGGELEYADPETLESAFEGRK